MNTRRSFIKKTGKSAIFASLAISSFSGYASRLKANSQKLIRIGIIGAENSHSIEYGKIINTEKKFPGVEVRYIWGETEEFARTIFLSPIAVLEALERSAISDSWEKVPSFV